MRRVLIITGRYLPGYKDGGPVRSILNLTSWMGDEIDIRIMCLDRDHGDDKPYDNIRLNDWNKVGKALVYYVERFDAVTIAGLADESDVVYCCGPYSDYAIAAMRLKKNHRIKAPLVVASMGSFSKEAFAIKGKKKSAFIKLMKLTGMFKNVIWSVTSEMEQKELRDIIGDSAECMIASDLPRPESYSHNAVKEKGSLRLVFISRISEKKNLILIPDILKKVDECYNVSIDIFGVAEDENYLNKCKNHFMELPGRIKWEFKGEADTKDVPLLFGKYDGFLFPTLGENYGHVIAESLGSGCIPVISDTTPWNEIGEKKCGYVCRLNEMDDFAKALNEIAAMSPAEYASYSDRALSYIEGKKRQDVAASGYKKIFDLQ